MSRSRRPSPASRRRAQPRHTDTTHARTLLSKKKHTRSHAWRRLWALSPLTRDTAATPAARRSGHRRPSLPPPLACSASPHSPPPFPRICGAPWRLHAAPQQTLTPLASGCRRTVNNHCSGCYPSTTTASSSPISSPSSNLGGVLLLLPLGFGHGLLHHGVVVGCTLSICPAYSTVVTHQSCCRSAAAPDDLPHRSNAFPYSPASPARRQARHLTARQGSWRTCRTWRWWTGASDTCSGWTKGLFRWTI